MSIQPKIIPQVLASNLKFDPTMLQQTQTNQCIDHYIRTKLTQLNDDLAIKNMIKNIIWPVKCPVCGKETGNLRFHAMQEPDADHAVLAVHVS